MTAQIEGGGADDREACGTCNGSGVVPDDDCHCSRLGSENYSLCPHVGQPCPECDSEPSPLNDGRPGPGDGSLRRRLVPIPAPAPEPSHYDEGQAWADYYGELLDQVVGQRNALRAERDALAAKLAALPEVPDGCEVLVVPSEVAVAWRKGWGVIAQPVNDEAVYVLHRTVEAALDAQARRPKPEPRTERVSWWEAAGRWLAEPLNDEGEIVRVECETGADPVAYLADGQQYEVDDDGTVEVLVEDGES